MTVGGLQTEFSFTLPKGYVDRNGALHRHGTMRLATARDEIEPLRDPRVNGAEDPFLTIVVLARVITELGTLSEITPATVEGLFAADLAFLQDVYGIINFGNPAELADLQQAVLGYDFAEDDITVVALDEVQPERHDERHDGATVAAAAAVEGNIFTAAVAVGATASAEGAGAVDAYPMAEAPLRRRAIEEVRGTER